MSLTSDPTRLIETSAPVHQLLVDRWSPRSFDATASIPLADLASILEAARLAPSANNSQPWRFIIAEHGSEDFATVIKSLAAGNQPWAKNVSALIVAVTEEIDEDGGVNAWAEYDLGQAVAHLSIQAHSMGYHTHQIGGFSPEMIRKAFTVSSNFRPVSVIALGVLAEADLLPEGYRQREVAPRTRKPLEALILP